MGIKDITFRNLYRIIEVVITTYGFACMNSSKNTLLYYILGLCWAFFGFVATIVLAYAFILVLKDALVGSVLGIGLGAVVVFVNPFWYRLHKQEKEVV